MKKKLLALLCVLTCIFGLTACGNVTYTEMQVQNINNAIEVSQNLMVVAEQYGPMLITSGYNKEELAAICQNAIGVEAEFGALDGLCTTWAQMSSDMEGIVNVGNPEPSIAGKEIVITYPVTGTVCDGQIVFKFSNDMFLRFHEGDAQAKTTFAMKMAQAGSNMGKAGLNTLLGMGTVFIMLIVISLIIGAFKFLQKKPKAAPAKVETAPAAPVAAVEEELVDDTELVAVIMAAIKAYEGNGSTDGFVVRSIKKANRRM